ncbi:hypothetical protein EMIT0162MI3_10783 [Pseudomonas chlororaphis]
MPYWRAAAVSCSGEKGMAMAIVCGEERGLHDAEGGVFNKISILCISIQF